MKKPFDTLHQGKTRLLVVVSAVVLLSCWGISLIQQGGLPIVGEASEGTNIELAIAAPLAPAAPVAVSETQPPPPLHRPSQAATILLGLISTGGLTGLAAHAFHHHIHGCGCVSLLAAIGIVALLAALFWWI